MHLNRLRAFVRVVECGSFSRAARSLGLTQPAVSQQIKSLEALLGTRLLVRGSDAVGLTPAGQRVLPYARRILQLWDALVDETRDEASGALSGRLAVGASTVPAGYLLGDLIGRFRRRHPRIDVTVRVADSAGVVAWVQEDRVDCGATGMRVPVPGVDHVVFARERLSVITPPDHPWAGRTVRPADLAAVPLVWRERGSGTRQAAEEALLRWGIDPRDIPVAAEVGSTEAVVGAVQAGLGLALISSLAAKTAMAAGRVGVARVDGPPAEREFYFIYKATRAGEPLLAAFLGFVREWAQDASGPARLGAVTGSDGDGPKDGLLS